MPFPYERYATLSGAFPVYFPAGEEEYARRVVQVLGRAGELLEQLLGLPLPAMQMLLVDPADWESAPHEDEDISIAQPYWTEVTSPPSLVVPLEIDPIFGEMTPTKLAFILYQMLALAFLESDPRPWPDESPLWADEWQLKFAALWLSQSLDGQQGMVNKDLREQYAEIFEPEPDGKTPDTVRSFDWYEDTAPEDYLGYELLLEQFASDLLARYDPGLLPRFLSSYRAKHDILLSDDVTAMLAAVLGPGGAEWLESLTYF
jgi:hypothetical protein